MILRASVISEFLTLEELEELNYNTMPYIKEKFRDIKFRRNRKCKSKATAYRFKKVVLQYAVREVVTRHGLVNRNKI